MKRSVVLISAIIFLSLTLSIFAGEQDFVLVNETGFTIDEMYLSPVTTSDWEEDVLGEDVLEDGEDIEITFFNNEDACKWDLKIIDEEGDVVYWKNIDLCVAAIITLYYENGEPTAEIE